MKKPNITEGEWSVEVRGYKLDSEDHVCVKNDDMVIAMCGLADNGYLDQSVRDAKSISVVPEMIDHLMCFYYHFMSQWESVNYHPSSNYLRDAHSVAETLIKAGCEPEKEDVEKFKKANIEL